MPKIKMKGSPPDESHIFMFYVIGHKIDWLFKFKVYLIVSWKVCYQNFLIY